ncbi:PREDICTED: uncharacterized protein LOC109218069 [Nicotiana attenuata]|uniref:DNA-directed DNA polymerase n=1 Tax=Nicotiana attenuata TaxID=49451 RepID=A0A1J6JWF0_NICAT|nr:PREDICTED: uncharacterized protein LOC109218069 [Nicotiana attenuata]OIT22082.1 dna polymerase [Nicotiana attenuata]
MSDEPVEVVAMGKKSRRPDHILALKAIKKIKRSPFIVADIEAALHDDVHVPCAVGFLVVKPGEDLASKSEYYIETYFSEDNDFSISDFKKRSERMMLDFIERLAAVVSDEKEIRTVYFHNFSRYDGIIVTRAFTSQIGKYSFQTVMRKHKMYELKVYRGNEKKKLLFRIRDSYLLLPAALNNLAQDLCPKFGSKGTIPYEKLRLEYLPEIGQQLLAYLKQDIRLLGGVMLKAQEIYWNLYKIDIVDTITLSSLALSIFRMHYYDPKSWPIHIPTRNQERFIRRGYYGGHADVYKPYG